MLGGNRRIIGDVQKQTLPRGIGTGIPCRQRCRGHSTTCRLDGRSMIIGAVLKPYDDRYPGAVDPSEIARSRGLQMLQQLIAPLGALLQKS